MGNKNKKICLVLFVLLLQPSHLYPMTVLVEKLGSAVATTLLTGVLNHLFSDTESKVDELITSNRLDQINIENTEVLPGINLAQAYQDHCVALRNSKIQGSLEFTHVNTEVFPDIRSYSQVLEPIIFEETNYSVGNVKCKIAFDTYSEIELNELKLRLTLLHQLARNKLDPAEQSVVNYLIKDKNAVLLTSYENTYKKLIKICDDASTTAFERAKYIFDLMEEIPKIEDASVRDIFQEAFEHLLSYCCQADETLDLTLEIGRAHV